MPSPTLSRVTRAYASGADRSRVHVGQVWRKESRTVTADFAGLLPAGTSIASATWTVRSPWLVSISDAAISGKTTSVTAAFQYGGCAWMRAVITTNTGETYTQTFEFTVRDCPDFDDENPSAGPYSLTVSA